ncbi:MAG: hypothetical protein K8I27_02745 [Planctomycetes bacterium]|nr:hypothetical protein [Planctomycetota bacterium]
MKLLIAGVVCLVAAVAGTSAWWLTNAEPAPQPQACVIIDPTMGRAKPTCSSCGDARHPTPPLLLEDYKQLLKQYGLEPMTESAALDSLCYYGVQTRDMVKQHGVFGLDAEREAFLREEITRTHAFLSVRVIDENGVVRVSMMRKKAAFDQRSHHEIDSAVGVIPPEISGTLKRVGLYHIWARF